MRVVRAGPGRVSVERGGAETASSRNWSAPCRRRPPSRYLPRLDDKRTPIAANMSSSQPLQGRIRDRRGLDHPTGAMSHTGRRSERVRIISRESTVVFSDFRGLCSISTKEMKNIHRVTSQLSMLWSPCYREWCRTVRS